MHTCGILRCCTMAAAVVQLTLGGRRMEHGTGHHSRRRFEHVGVTPVVWSDGKNYTSGRSACRRARKVGNHRFRWLRAFQGFSFPRQEGSSGSSPVGLHQGCSLASQRWLPRGCRPPPPPPTAWPCRATLTTVSDCRTPRQPVETWWTTTKFWACRDRPRPRTLKRRK